MIEDGLCGLGQVCRDAHLLRGSFGIMQDGIAKAPPIRIMGNLKRANKEAIKCEFRRCDRLSEVHGEMQSPRSDISF